jgi:hypothetical protein
MILLTDGDGLLNPFCLQQAKQHYITIYTIGLRSAVNSGLPGTIASETRGQYSQVELQKHPAAEKHAFLWTTIGTS